MSLKTKQFTGLDKLYIGILFTIFGGIVLHAPLIASLGNAFPAADIYVKAWKEVLMAVAVVVVGIILTRNKQLAMLKRPIVLIMGGYILLHLLLVPFSWQGVTATIAGLLIDVRYIVFFLLLYVAVILYPSIRKPLLYTFFGGALVVCIFAVLQVFILPRDILSYIGYNKNTIIPYLFVDANEQFLRINSTLRGPNPLGAYAVIVLSLLAAVWLRAKKITSRKQVIVASILAFGGIVALWCSYSRSALVAIVASIGILLTTIFARKLKAWMLIMAGVILVALVVGLVAARNTSFVSNVFLHDNATTGAKSNSNEGHVGSVQDGVNRMVHQPLGGGVGSTGSASLYGNNPTIIENQYLFIAHEVGWPGLILFIIITIKLLQLLWHRREDWLALGVFASGIGMALIGLLLPVWVDDTVAIIWWGLAAIALASKGESDGRTIHKTSKRTA